MSGADRAREDREIRRLGLQALHGAYRGRPYVVSRALNRLESIGQHAWQPVMSGWAAAAIHALDAARRAGRPLQGPIMYESGQWQLRFIDRYGRHLQPEQVASSMDLLTLRFIVAAGNGDHATAEALIVAAGDGEDRARYVVSLLRTCAALFMANHP